MAPRERLTCEQKGKSVAEGPDLARGVDPSSVDDRLHREALSDMAGLDIPNYNIITDHPNKTHKWKKNYFYVKVNEFAFHEPPGDEFPVSWADHPKTLDYPKGFFDSARAIACLSHSRWPDISEDRVRRALERISRATPYLAIPTLFPQDWDSRVPVLKKGGGKRLALFTNRQHARLNRARKIENIIDLSDLIDDELDSHQANPMSILDDMDLGGSFAGIHKPMSRPKKRRRGSRDLIGVVTILGYGSVRRRGWFSGFVDRPGGAVGDLAVGTSVHQDEVLTTPTAGGVEDQPVEDPELDRDPVSVQDLQAPDEPPLSEGPPIDLVEFLHPGNTLLVEDRGRCAELGIGSSNLLIAKFEKELKNTFVQLGRVQEVAQEKDCSLARKGEELEAAKRALQKTESHAAKRKKKMKAKISMLGLELEVARRSNEELKEKNTKVEREKAKLDQEKAAMLLKAAEEPSRSRESRRFLVEKEKERVEAAMIEKCDRRFANIREYQVRRQAYDDKCLLYAQAFDTKKCLQKLLTRNQPLTQSTVAFFERKEQSLKAEADTQWIGGIPEADLSLSPLVLSPQASPNAEWSASNSEGLFVDQAGANATGNQAETDAVRVQGPGISRTGAEDASE
ncbi:hypothetical protein N665_0532s0046 [Sinapis alba]|nr:hypothetical protein N665_0532s0046 [Sinapis alba]